MYTGSIVPDGIPKIFFNIRLSSKGPQETIRENILRLELKRSGHLSNIGNTSKTNPTTH